MHPIAYPMRKIKWFKIADSVADIHFQTNNLAIAEADGKKITLALLQNKILACAHKCPQWYTGRWFYRWQWQYCLPFAPLPF